MMKNNRNQFEFTGAIFKEGKRFVSLCLELDVASQGSNIHEAKTMLAEAVEVYLETCFESNLPFFRPVPRDDDPRINPKENLVEIFPLGVKVKILAGV
jgi:predicted RNase H-like HicB family nuclease